MFSITVTVNAFGQVSVIATDRAGGGAYGVAAKHGGDLGGATHDEAVDLMKRGLRADWERFDHLMPHLRDAVGALIMCLPPPEFFDDNGEPK